MVFLINLIIPLLELKITINKFNEFTYHWWAWSHRYLFLQNVHKIKKIKRIYVIDKMEEKILNIINLNYKKK